MLYVHIYILYNYVPLFRLLDFVEVVLNVVEVAPGDPFQFADLEFGVRVEDPPLVLDTEETFAPNITALFNQILNITMKDMQKETITELPPAMASLSSALLYPADNNGSRLRISTSIYGRDSLFQQRQSFTIRNNRERQRIGSIILDLSLRQNGKIIKVTSSPNSNVVHPSFTKTRVSYMRRSIYLLESIVDQRLFMFEPV